MAYNDIEKRKIEELASQVPQGTIWAYKDSTYKVRDYAIIKGDPEDSPGVVYAKHPMEQGMEDLAENLYVRPSVSWLAKFTLVGSGVDVPHEIEPPADM
jgi:hypothetical protein